MLEPNPDREEFVPEALRRSDDRHSPASDASDVSTAAAGVAAEGGASRIAAAATAAAVVRPGLVTLAGRFLIFAYKVVVRFI